MPKPFWKCWLISLILASIAVPCLAGDDPPPWEAKRFSEDTASLYTAASQVHVPAGSNVVVLYEEQRCQFDSEGRSIQTWYIVYKVLSQQGAEQWGEASNYWEPWHEEQPVLRARVITPDHAVHLLDPKTITNNPAKEDQNDVFSDRQVVRAPLPAIAPGSFVEEEHVTKETSPISGAGTLSYFTFAQGVPSQRMRLVLEFPSSLPLRYTTELLPEMKPERKEENGLVTITFDRGPAESFDRAEDFVPSDVPIYARVWYSTGSSWQRIAQDYAKVIDQRIAKDDVSALVGKLTTGKSSREAKTTALLQYLDNEVRYTGIEFGEAAFTPHALSETLSHRYGDCKDKSVLLVAMLRTAGIPAFPALLNVDNHPDLPPELPGMGLFDHMIVYVPGSPDFWIDATDEYARLGQLPAGDQGRLALVVRPESESLIRIPVTPSGDNLLLQKREFYLAEYGPARVIQISQPHGSLESEYRANYADKDNKDRRKQLTEYMHSQYLAEKLDRVDPSDSADISKQFELALEAGKAKRGFTDLDVAVVAIRLDTLFERLPEELQQREKEEPKSGESPADKPKKPRTTDYQLPSAFVTEWDYQVVPPFGFQPKPLPKDAKLSLGPALLTETFSVDKNGIVHGVIRFDSVKSRFNISEATELRNQVAQTLAGAPILISFEPAGQALLTLGKVRESMEAFRSSITTHPKEAVHHLQLARALLSVGLGDAARAEAQTAVKLEPNWAPAQETLADICQYDLVGRKFRLGSDYSQAAAAYRAAQKLDPDDKSITGNLGILLEFNKYGERYGSGAQLKEAIAEYNKLKPEDLAGLGLQNNPPFAMVYAGEYAEARKHAESLNPQPLVVIASVEAAVNGSAAGIAEARKRAAAEAAFKQILANSATILMRLQKYSEAGDFLENSASGDNASNTAAFAANLRKARPHAEMHFNNDPAGVVLRFFVGVVDGSLTVDQFKLLGSHNARLVMNRTDSDDLKQAMGFGGQFRSQFSRSGLPVEAMIDMVIQLIESKTEGTDASGYRVTLRAPGAQTLIMFVVKEDGEYKILDSVERPNSVALEVLDRLAAGDLAGARALLDWVRDAQHLVGGDDPFAGYAFPRFWTKGKEATAGQMKLAAAALLAEKKETAEEGITILDAARASAASDTEKLNLLLGLRYGYIQLNQYAKLLEIANQLADQDPQSKILFLNREFSLRGLGRTEEADRFAQERLQKLPEDLDAMRELYLNAVARNNFTQARERLHRIIDSGKAEANDLNSLAWNSLFIPDVKQEDLDAALKSAQLSQNSPQILHTLGSLYAEAGKVKEAREVLVQAMDLANLDEPSSIYWYAFGRIAEQCGEVEIARADYERVEKPKNPLDIPNSTYQLAQNRLKVLGVTPNTKPAK
jgi:tetratricopeptide (TPR) repeat protein/transglutaminase-like putative cysteine protease